ncbi:Putative GroES-like superfamily, alcohol dehydrogenase-like, NAD(P)-binding domain superfamily [Septoria linicola]|uniref:GroES-like superfamily, alcohol dehydrogenase-like, NAD(P)-binding domain superfamily n=1 Tax=Septoria linicola TaxID=215465 RepID=A0A9Q9EKH3_9PEZI|nr:Putative GroES-like superfamily, alcohol dehydrogenase-like, NAD(P)-binding domain superfamily [Septoria linicola]
MAAQIKQAINSVMPGAGGNQAAWIDKEPRNPLRVGPADTPTAGDGEIVVKNHAIAINPVDWKIQDYGIFVQQFPFILGTDVAGEVVEVGSNVTRFKKGDRVLGHAISLGNQKSQHGGFQLYTAIDESFAAPIPSKLSFTEATVLPLAISTAGQGLYDEREKGFLGLPYPSLEPQPCNKTIVVWGGSSSVGALAIQLATASGAKVVAVASKHNHAFVKKLGAVAAVDYNDPTIVDDVVKGIQTAGGEFAGVYDAIANEGSHEYVFEIVKQFRGGNNVAGTLAAPEGGAPEGVKYGSVFAINPVNKPIWENYVGQALESGKLQAVPEPIVVGKGLENVQKGLDTNKAGVSAKKVVVEL